MKIYIYSMNSAEFKFSENAHQFPKLSGKKVFQISMNKFISILSNPSHRSEQQRSSIMLSITLLKLFIDSTLQPFLRNLQSNLISVRSPIFHYRNCSDIIANIMISIKIGQFSKVPNYATNSICN